ncbi:MAG: hypothetical protein Q8882_06110, partial [Bacillota bacterium]|nr:hypothetical protein [Bacillota bacterium]
ITMKGYNKWNYKPFVLQFNHPYICRLVPGNTSVTFQWKDDYDKGPHTVRYKGREEKEWKSKRLTSEMHTIEGLEPRVTYEIAIFNSNGFQGASRLFNTGIYPGTLINYNHFEDKQYLFSGRCLGSPSLLRLPSGSLLASHDIFGGGMGAQRQENFTNIFRSDDDGKTWYLVSELFSCFWPSMFLHHGKLYIIACSRVYGDLLVGCSEDEGKTWSMPTVIARSCCAHGDNEGFHKSAGKVLKSHGRLWLGIEYGCWSCGTFRNTLLSIDENADLLDAENWTFTSFTPPARDVPGAIKGVPGALEGISMESLDGQYIYDIARYSNGLAMVLKVKADDPEGNLEFYKFSKIPVAHSKFEIIKHDDGWYYTIGNIPPARTILCVYRSRDLENWEFVSKILDFEGCSVNKVGVQYPSVLLEGRTLSFLSRTAMNNSESFHDSNCITFHRVEI